MNDDIWIVLTNTSEVDLAGGNDTLRLSSNFSGYQFSRVVGSNTSINISSSGQTVLIKNVESFQFADVTKTITEILTQLPWFAFLNCWIYSSGYLILLNQHCI